MKVELWCLGKNSFDYLEIGISDYIRRINRSVPMAIQIFHLPKARKNDREDRIRLMEADMIEQQLQPTDHLILLDEKGKKMNSVAFASFIQEKFNHTSGRLIFLIGGAYGFDQRLYNRANGKISFSEMTFNHLLFRLMFAEQFYRAISILEGKPYHHE